MKFIIIGFSALAVLAGASLHQGALPGFGTAESEAVRAVEEEAEYGAEGELIEEEIERDVFEDSGETEGVKRAPVVVVDGVTLRAHFRKGAEGVYLKFSLHNPTARDRTISVKYSARRTEEAPEDSRMAEIPELVKEETLTVTVPASEKATRSILLRKGARRAKRPVVWTLEVSRRPMKSAAGWGAEIPGSKGGPVVLRKGRVLLAHADLTY